MDEASTPTTGDVKVLFRAIVIQRNSMDPVVTNVDNGLLLPPPNRRISFVSARPPTSLHQFIENSGSSASPNFGRDQPHVPTVKSTPTDFQDRLSPPARCLSGNREIFEVDNIVDSFLGSMRSTRKNLNEIAICDWIDFAE